VVLLALLSVRLQERAMLAFRCVWIRHPPKPEPGRSLAIHGRDQAVFDPLPDWRALAQWRQSHFYPHGPRDDRPLEELPVAELRALKRAEEQAFDRFLNARAVLIEAQRTEAARG
jgi:hypothetical protein